MNFSKINLILALCLLSVLSCSVFVKATTYTQSSKDAPTVDLSATKKPPSNTAAPSAEPSAENPATGSSYPTGLSVTVTGPAAIVPTATPTYGWSHTAPTGYAPSGSSSPTPSSPALTPSAGNSLRSVAVDNLIYIGLFLCSAAFYLNF
ncbi:18079_t:CDS:2 [Dentiscutata erythropus]|uniref:18079_t:CDS:1 n=1 Tax=Dentiscutata erythropus TaxID=1348616 RepID=A0A9N9GJM7_9GLOM|nr:18079_t:CDS:2 [Dentiscutata erythropus]